jgi:hypothetical protein
MQEMERKKTAETVLEVLNRLSGEIKIIHRRIDQLMSVNVFSAAPILFSKSYNEKMNLHFKYSLGCVRNKYKKSVIRQFEIEEKAYKLAKETGADFESVRDMLLWELQGFF